jgi:mRNA interferase MazF
MPISERGTVVRVPFPYTDRPVQQRRPALVVSAVSLGDRGQLLWVVMITSAENRRWPGDIEFGDTFAAAGLPAPSLIRMAKIATIEAGATEPLGHIGAELLEKVEAALIHQLGLVGRAPQSIA